MPTTQIKIVASSETDPYSRIHGKSIDEELDYNFYDTQPDKIIGHAMREFKHVQEVNLKPGDHFVMYSNSGYHYDPWYAKIYVNGKLVGKGNVYRSKPLRVYFSVGVAPPTPPKLKKKFEGPLKIWPFPMINRFLIPTEPKARFISKHRTHIKTY